MDQPFDVFEAKAVKAGFERCLAEEFIDDIGRVETFAVWACRRSGILMVGETYNGKICSALLHF